MRLITIFELSTRTEAELRGLHRAVSQALARSEAGSAHRRNAIASLENIARVLHARLKP